MVRRPLAKHSVDDAARSKFVKVDSNDIFRSDARNAKNGGGGNEYKKNDKGKLRNLSQKVTCAMNSACLGKKKKKN